MDEQARGLLDAARGVLGELDVEIVIDRGARVGARVDGRAVCGARRA
jgi:hypothetical protein